MVYILTFFKDSRQKYSFVANYPQVKIYLRVSI